MFEGNWGAKKKINEQENKLSRFTIPKLENNFSQREHDFMEGALIFFAQKDVSRWGEVDRSDEERSQMREMLAEHVAGINMLIRIVKERAKRENDADILSLDWEEIDKIVQLHDVAEVIFGDKITKTSFDEEQEDIAQQVMIHETEKRNMGGWVSRALDHYWEKSPSGAKNSREANFVKTIDEIEGVMQMFHARRLDRNKRGYDAHIDFFKKYSRDFPSLQKTALYMIEQWKNLKDDIEWADLNRSHQFEMDLE